MASKSGAQGGGQLKLRTRVLALKPRAVALGRPTKKGELLRAGIAQLAALDGPSFLAVVSVVPSVKTGRPKQEKPGSGRMPLH